MCNNASVLLFQQIRKHNLQLHYYQYLLELLLVSLSNISGLVLHNVWRCMRHFVGISHWCTSLSDVQLIRNESETKSTMFYETLIFIVTFSGDKRIRQNSRGLIGTIQLGETYFSWYYSVLIKWNLLYT